MRCEELLQKAAAYCSVAERCESEVRAKLTVWDKDNCVQEESIEQIINYLRENNYLSDSRYCKTFVHDKLLYQGWGREKMRIMLQMKGLPKETICEALEGIDEEEYMRVLKHLAERKSKETKGVREKVIRFLLSRGFSFQEIHNL